MLKKHIDIFVDDKNIGSISISIDEEYANEINTPNDIGETLEAFISKLITKNSVQNRLQ